MAEETPTPQENTSSLVVEPIEVSKGTSDIKQYQDPVPDTGYIPLQDFLGISHPVDEEKEKLDYIWRSYAKGRDRTETLEAIKEAQRRMAPPALGENYLHKLYSYTRLIEDGRNIERERKTYEGDNIVGNSQP